MSAATFASKLAPYCVAFGKIASTDAGKRLIARAYMNDRDFSFESRRNSMFADKRPTRASERHNYFIAASLYARNAYADAFAALMCDAEPDLALTNARRFVNAELFMFAHRTREQQNAAPAAFFDRFACDY